MRIPDALPPGAIRKSRVSRHELCTNTQGDYAEGLLGIDIMEEERRHDDLAPGSSCVGGTSLQVLDYGKPCYSVCKPTCPRGARLQQLRYVDDDRWFVVMISGFHEAPLLFFELRTVAAGEFLDGFAGRFIHHIAMKPKTCQGLACTEDLCQVARPLGANAIVVEVQLSQRSVHCDRVCHNCGTFITKTIAADVESCESWGFGQCSRNGSRPICTKLITVQQQLP
mmetsp:Transcript_121155/g.314617  ORF Transcript_121155/g.314617 Transcript_121155/m.314617 type:complete len:225 (+) Transcript_121155:187-861(+)